MSNEENLLPSEPTEELDENAPLTPEQLTYVRKSGLIGTLVGLACGGTMLTIANEAAKQPELYRSIDPDAGRVIAGAFFLFSGLIYLSTKNYARLNAPSNQE